MRPIIEKCIAYCMSVDVTIRGFFFSLVLAPCFSVVRQGRTHTAAAKEKCKIILHKS